jgi:glucuronate isomerase
MFTEVPPLQQRIERMIDDVTIVDPHTHLRCDSLGAPDLASLMSYHWVQTELRSVGMPPSDLDPKIDPTERVRRAIPYLRRMRNTAMAWCFYRILRDLYDLEDPHLTETNYRAICERVEQSGRDPVWAENLLRKKCRIARAVTSLGNRGKDPRKHEDWILFMLDAHYLFCPGVATDLEPFFTGRTTKAPYTQALIDILGELPRDAHTLDQGIRDWLDRTVTGRVRFTNTFIPIETRFHPPERTAINSALQRADQRTPLTDEEIDQLVQGVTWSVLGWHHDHRKAFQIAVGAEYFICDGKSIPRFQQTWISEMARVFHHFGQARFDLMVATDALAQDIAVMLRQFPNVYSSGYWWHNFFPDLITRVAGLRFQIAPAPKFSAFLCDAYYAEWTYGKLQVVRKALAAALAKLVETGFYEEEYLPELLQQVLHDSPRDLYDLADAP